MVAFNKVQIQELMTKLTREFYTKDLGQDHNANSSRQKREECLAFLEELPTKSIETLQYARL